MTAVNDATTPPLPDPLDRRVWAVDPDRRWAEAALQDQLSGEWTYVQPRPARAGAARVSLKARPEDMAAQVTEALPGEPLEALWDTGDGWQYVRTAHDRYLGWARASALVAGDPGALQVTVLRGHAFAGPKVSRAILAELSHGSRLTAGAAEGVTEDHRRWQPVVLPDGRDAWVQDVTLAPLTGTDPAAFALRFLETPYVWGGRSAWGLDCSGLTQVVYAAAGWALPRDADQQQAALTPVDVPQAGDLAFFPGHVGLMLDGRRMIHANATHMRVTIETLGEGDYGARLAASRTGYGRWPS